MLIGGVADTHTSKVVLRCKSAPERLPVLTCPTSFPHLLTARPVPAVPGPYPSITSVSNPLPGLTAYKSLMFHFLPDLKGVFGPNLANT